MANFCVAQQHPNLILTKSGVELIRTSKQDVPLFTKALKITKQEVDSEIEKGIFVPIPKDMAGGYTHQRHKKNFFILQKAGNLYQITGNEKYAVYIRDMFAEYAKMFPNLGLHPTMKSYATGKIFWQCLNDANWLVYSSQAYDAIYDFLTKEERDNLEKNLFRPLADFISLENPRFFNRIHNHSTWGNAAVGMIGLVMNDEELIQRALYGIQNDGLNDKMRDNDGGFIKGKEQKRAGFLAQLDYSFSPDGYFTEGPYYLRYAMTPFLLFARSLHNTRPDLKIYDYRDSILKKAVYSLLNQTDANGRFFPINDAQKGMSWNAREVVSAVDIAYADFGNDPELLSIAEKQDIVLLDDTGFLVARDLASGKAKSLLQKSIAYRDGADGKKGGVAILRDSKADGGEICAVVKYSAQGMGHGHFDKLSYSLYDDVGEVIQDYGAARWVNINQKGGGRYLKENKTWAKQSIAHNTLVINETSHYEGNIRIGEKYHPELYYFKGTGDVKVVSSISKNAYEGVVLQRTMILLKDEEFEQPILIDVFKANAKEKSQFDLPTWYQGQLLLANFEYKSELTTLATLGEGHGYQHLWKEASGQSTGDNAHIDWFSNGKFYSMTSVVDAGDELIFARIGANDPEYNLRRDPTFIIRKKDKRSATFASIIEPHGKYTWSTELAEQPFTNVAQLTIVADNKDYTIIQFSNKTGKEWALALAHNDASKTSKHQVKVGAKNYEWTGMYELSN